MPFVYKWTYFKTTDGNEFVFTGQIDPNGCPNGIVRAIFRHGNLFEGNMTYDGAFNGWGIHYCQNSVIQIGWWEDSYLNGNCITVTDQWI